MMITSTKKRSVGFLIMIFLLCAGNLTAQSTAGDDKFVCLGGNTQIGAVPAPCAGCCVKWTPATGLSDPLAAMPEVTGLTTSTEYTMTYVYADGTMTTDKVVVFVYELEVNVYKPPVFNASGMEEQVPPGELNSKGVQTFVNLDSDDIDKKIDINDDNGVIGEDEMFRVEIKLQLKGTAAGTPSTNPTVKLALSGETASLKFWKDKDKSDDYSPGNDLSLTGIAPLYTGNLWGEGVAAHNLPKSVQMKIEVTDVGSGSTLCSSSEISVTVLGVNSIVWEGVGNGYTGDGRNNSEVLDSYPSENGYPPHIRIFPENKFPAGALEPTASIFNTAKIKVTLSTTPVEPIDLYFQILDPDDPNNDLRIDPNDDGGANGVYEGTGNKLTWTQHSDNRGEVGGNKFGNLAIGSSSVTALGKGIYKINVSDASFYLGALEVSFFLGDNYQVAIYCDLNFIEKLRNEDKKDQKEIVFVPNSGTPPGIDPSLTSPVLTVWRTVHVEHDNMENPIWSNNNIVNAFFSDFSGVDKKLSMATAILGMYNSFLAEKPLYEGNVPSSNTGRFENGRMRIGSLTIPGSDLPLVVCDGCLKSNSDNGISFKNPTDLLLGGSAVFVKLHSFTIPDEPSFPVKEIKKITGGFEVTIKNPAPEVDLTPFAGGQANVHGGGFTHSNLLIIDNTHFVIQNSPAGVSTLKIPVEIADDDDIPWPTNPAAPAASTLIQTPDFSLTMNELKELYMDVVLDGGGRMADNENSLLFRRNYYAVGDVVTPILGIGDISTIIDKTYGYDSDRYKREGYWCVYTISAWQGRISKDLDGENFDVSLATSFGDYPVSDCEVAPGSNATVLWCETIRDGMENLTETLFHEIGHQFGLTHGFDEPGGACGTCFNISATDSSCPDKMGIMNASPPNLPYSKIIPKQKNFIRCRKGSPGRPSNF